MTNFTGRRVFGILFSELTKADLVEKVLVPQIAGSGVKLIVTTNIDHVVNLVRNSRFREAYATAWLATTDGVPVFLYARFVRSPVRRRVSGPDFFAALMPALRPGDHRPFFVVSNENTGIEISRWLESRGFTADSIGYYVPRFGFEKDQRESTLIVDHVRERNATHLILGVGSPKSEMWVYDHRDELGDLCAFGIGAGVDFFVGLEKRAPLWMQNTGLEWTWRLGREPSRLWKRYLVDSRLFFVAIWNDLLTGGAAPVRES
jgi:N-acetylglucosaminyldiphosphoundecaprenol N-acetyl-beta-D-mannosaminyltransferase